MPRQFLRLVQAAPGIHQNARDAVAQIMDPQLRYPRRSGLGACQSAGAVMELASVGLRLPLAQLYEDVALQAKSASSAYPTSASSS